MSLTTTQPGTRPRSAARRIVGRRAVRVAAVACGLAVSACGGVAGAGAAADSTPVGGTAEAVALAARVIPGVDWPTFNFDSARTGVGPAHTGIGPRELGHLRRQIIPLDGTVDSAPIELHAVRAAGAVRDVIVVTTTYGRTIALDARSGHRLWEYTPATIGDYAGTYQVTNSTPVADPGRAYIYAAAPDGRIRKLRLADGREVRSGHWPAVVTRLPHFSPGGSQGGEKIASPLNISGRWVVVTTGGYIGDFPPYQGHVALIDRASGKVAHVWNSLCSDRHRLIVPSSCRSAESAIWARAGAVVEPGSGRLLVATGNGPFNGRTDWGDSVLELTPDASRLLHNWTPTNQAELAGADTDVGSTAPVLLPPYGGRRLLVQGGKDARLHLLDLARLNGTAGRASRRTGGELSEIGTPGDSPLLMASAVATVRGRIMVFVADYSATGAYTVVGSPAHPRLRQVWSDGTPGTSPVLAGGLLYVFDPSGHLVIRNPADGHTVASLPTATGHWNSPIIAGGRIVLPTGNYASHKQSGQLIIWHSPGA